jgi:RimJ/RimL family protein N-acetyltransferase
MDVHQEVVVLEAIRRRYPGLLLPPTNVAAVRAQGRRYEVLCDDPRQPRYVLVIHEHGPPLGRIDVIVEGETPDGVRNLLERLPAAQTFFFVSRKEWANALIQEQFDVTDEGHRWRYRVTRQAFRPASTEGVRELTEADEEIVRRYAEQGEERTYTHYFGHQMQNARAGVEGLGLHTFGRFDGSDLVSVAVASRAAQEVVWVHTQPSRRRQGHARAVVTAATEWLLTHTGQAYYSIDEGHAASRRVCEGLGYTVCQQTWRWQGRRKT